MKKICDTPKLMEIKKIDSEDVVLIVAETGDEFPMMLERAYFLIGKDIASSRGFHGHKKLSQFFVCLAGSATIKLHDGISQKEFSLEKNGKGLFLPPGFWREIDLSPNAILCVLASDKYDESDYIRDFGEFLRYKDNQKNIEAVPFMPLQRLNDEYESRFLQLLKYELRHGAFILGESVSKFEKEFADFNVVKHAIGCGNGLDAIYLSLLALNLEPSSKVLIPTNSFIATALAVEKAGLEPVFVDCEQYGHGISLEDASQKIDSDVTCIIPVHLFGVPDKMPEIMELSQKHGLRVIEDCAQAHGALIDGKAVGTFGDFGCFSFYPTKNLGALGDGGCIITGSDILAKKVRVIGNYGSEEKYHHDNFGVNSRLDSLQAAFLSEKLTYLARDNQKRNKIAAIYDSQLNEVEEVMLISVPESYYAVWHLYPVVLTNVLRDKVREYLANKGIETGLHYPVPIHKSGVYDSDMSLVNSEFFSSNSLTLPMSPVTTKDEALLVSQLLIEAVRVLR